MTTRRASRSYAAAVFFIAVIFALSSCTSSEKEADGQSDSGSAEFSDQIPPDLASEELGSPVAQSGPVSGSIEDELTLEFDPGATPQAAPSAPAPQSQSGNVDIRDIRYVSRAGGSVVVDTSGPATYRTREEYGRNQMVIEIANANLPDRLKRPYVTKDFGQSITSINAYQDRGSSTVRVVVQFRDGMRADVRQSGSSLVLVPAGAVAPQIAAAPMEQAREAQPVEFTASSLEAGAEVDDSRILPTSSVDSSNGESMRFYGKPVSIEVRDTSIRDVINLIAEQSGANIVVSSEVDGNVTLKLRQVPWDQALLIVMKTRNLGYVRQGSILRIAPYEALHREAESTRKVAEAQKLAEPLRVKVIPVSYAKVDSLDKQVLALLTPNRGKAVGDVRTNSMIVTDTPEVLDRVSNLIKALDSPPLQVLIEGKVIEARDVFTREIGVNWSLSGQDVDLGNNRFFGSNLSVSPGAISANSLSSNFRFGTIDVFGDLSATLALYENEDQVRIVSSPRVVALNNEPASIVQKTEVPLTQTVAANGVTTITTTFKPVEMRLEVTPQVTSASDILLSMMIKREFLSEKEANAQAAVVNSREAKTKVLVRNGQTAVVGGVYQSDVNDNETGVPWLRKMPVFGWLFKKKAHRNAKNELLVFLTPRLLNAESSMPKGATLE